MCLVFIAVVCKCGTDIQHFLQNTTRAHDLPGQYSSTMCDARRSAKGPMMNIVTHVIETQWSCLRDTATLQSLHIILPSRCCLNFPARNAGLTTVHLLVDASCRSREIATIAGVIAVAMIHTPPGPAAVRTGVPRAYIMSGLTGIAVKFGLEGPLFAKLAEISVCPFSLWIRGRRKAVCQPHSLQDKHTRDNGQPPGAPCRLCARAPRLLRP